MRIVRLRIKNLNSLRDEVTIDFAGAPLGETGLFAIVGDTGAGKTTILDGITLALYGRVHRNKNIKEVLSYGAVECEAEVEFETGGERYLAQWSTYRARKKVDGNIQDPQRKLSLFNREKNAFEGLAEKTREVEMAVEEVTGLDYDRFSRSVLLAQGDFAAFLKATEKDRSDLLERITGTEIYSKLSEKAFERFRLEEAQLANLKQQRTALDLLPKGALEELKKEGKDYKKQILSLQAELNQVQESRNWLLQIANLESQLAAANQEWSDLQTRKEEAAQDEIRLKAHQKALPLEKDLAILDRIYQEIQGSQLRKSKLETERLEFEQQILSGQKALQAQQEAVAQWKIHQQEQETLFEKVEELDRQIAQRRQKVDLEAEELASQTQTLTERTGEQKEVEAAIDQTRLDLHAHKTWLDSQKNLSGITDSLSGLRRIHLDLQASETFIAEKSAQIQQFTAREKEYAHTLQRLSESLSRLAAEKEALLQQMEQLQPGEAPLSRTDLLQRKNLEIERLRNQKDHFDRYFEWLQTYQMLVREQTSFQEQLEHLRARELDLNQEVLSSLETLERWREKLRYKRHIYEQQLAIANYDRDRQQLREGDPCPLCFSTQHPFRAHADADAWKAHPDEARQEWEAADRKYEKVYQEHQALLQQQSELYLQLEQLAGKELDQFGGRLKDQLARLLEVEGKLSGLFNHLQEDDWTHPSLSLAQERKKWHEQALLELQERWEKLLRLDRQLADLELEERGKKDDFQKKDMQFQLQAQEKALAILQLKERQAEQAHQQQMWEKALASLSAAVDETSRDAVLQTLEKLQLDFQSHQKAYQEAGQTLQILESQQQQLAQILAQVREACQKREAALQRESLELKKLEEKRFEWFGDKNCRTERAQIEAEVEAAKRKETALETAFTGLTHQRQSLEKELEQLMQSLDLQRADQEAKQTLLTQKLKNAGFSAEEEAREALLEEVEAEQLAQRLNQLREKEIEWKKTRTQLESQLEKTRKQEVAAQSLESLEASLAALSEQIGLLQQKLGAVNRDLERNEKQERKAKALLEDIERQQQEFNRWAALNEVIGSKDGKKFRVFAQGLTLQRLVGLANQHLQHLNERYLIRKRPGEDLELDIIDTFQANHRRSMNTLSGGESFLVSLALALGLSDLAGRRSNIRSLFIDEGFGTLDEATLDMAISTLENLQARGKTIGIISHVKELKERISTQIRVLKKGSGFSQVEVVG